MPKDRGIKGIPPQDHTEAVRRLESLNGKNHVRWHELLRLVITYARWRRPEEEREPFLAAAEEVLTDAARQREVQTMGRTIAEYDFAKGEVKALQKTVLRLCRQRFGEPSAEIAAAVTAVTDLERLERMTDRLLQGGSWQELLDTP